MGRRRRRREGLEGVVKGDRWYRVAKTRRIP